MDKLASITKITEAELDVMSALWEADRPLNITELKEKICQKGIGAAIQSRLCCAVYATKEWLDKKNGRYSIIIR